MQITGSAVTGSMTLPPAVILAGGRSRRMGVPDKCLLSLGGMSIIEHVVEPIAPQVGRIAVNTNSDPGKFVSFGLPVIADTILGYHGPLGGILAGMLWARDFDPRAEMLVWVPADVPFLPDNLISGLMAARQGADIVVAAGGGRLHPTIGLWSTALAERLFHDLTHTDMRKLTQWLRQFRVREVEFAADFPNINDEKDLFQARAALTLARQGSSCRLI